VLKEHRPEIIFHAAITAVSPSSVAARGISAVGAQSIARGVLLLGLVVALVGIIQKAVGLKNNYNTSDSCSGG
jgi:hypothetical protein